MIDPDKVKPGDKLMVEFVRMHTNSLWALVKNTNDGALCAVEFAALSPLPEPSPGPHAGLRDAVVEAAQRFIKGWHETGISQTNDLLGLAWKVDALNAAMKPVDPRDELLVAAKAVAEQGTMPPDDRNRLRAAIAAVEAMGREA